MLDVGGIVLGEEFDLRRGTLEAVMLLEGRKQHLADKPVICPSCALCIASTTSTGSVATVLTLQADL